VCWVPWVAMAGSQAWPVVMTACRCRRIAAVIRVCAWARVSLLSSLGGQVLVAGGIDRVGALCSQTVQTRKANATIPAGPP
jgi:hypothetical protein